MRDRSDRDGFVGWAPPTDPSGRAEDRWAVPTYPREHADVFQRNYFGRLGFDSPTREAPLVLPAILNPFVDEAPAAIITRIALDWIIDGTPLDELFDEVAE